MQGPCEVRSWEFDSAASNSGQFPLNTVLSWEGARRPMNLSVGAYIIDYLRRGCLQFFPPSPQHKVQLL